MRAPLLLGMASLALTSFWPAGQPVRAQQSKPPQFRASLDLIQIDVTVLDSFRRPVRGLTAEDFTLLEDGEPREILGFAEVHIPDASDGPAWIKDSAPDVRTADDGRVIVFLLDDAQTDAVAEPKLWTETVTRITGDIIDQMGPTDVAAVLCTFDNKCAQDFTNDRALLKAAIAKFSPKKFSTAGGRGSWQYDWYRQSAGVTSSVVKQLIEQPGRRKAMIYVTPRTLMRPAVWPPRPGNLNGAVTQDQVQTAFEEALRSKVTVYGLSPTGLAGLVDPARLDPNAIVPVPGQRPPRFTAPPASIAGETGGFMVTKPELFAAGVTQIFRETGSYYLLGYEKTKRTKSAAGNPSETYRSIDVSVNRPGTEVRARTWYVEPRPEKAATAAPAADVAVAGVLPKSNLPLRVIAAPFAVPGQPDALVSIALGVREPAPAERAFEHLDVQARAFTQRGDPRGATAHSVDVRLPPGQGDTEFDVVTELRLKPGVYALRFSARSERMGTAGSVYADVVVPDFARDALSVSGLVISATPQMTSVPAGDLTSTATAVSTTRRTFTDAHRVRAFMRVYQGGRLPLAPVALAIRIISDQNQVAIEERKALDVGRFNADRAADFSYDLPIASLPPGLYLLRIEAGIGADAIRRDVRFTVNR